MTDKKEEKLVIVESPTKAKTITRFLGNEYLIDSSFGHIRDLPKSKLGIDVENNYEPQYVIPTKSRKQVNKLKKEAAKAAMVILATDEDREGEAIAYHLVEALDLEDKLNKGAVKRIVFHEITENAINEAIKNPRGINYDLVNAQQARRVLDRLVGYNLSPFLWKKVMRGLSAGRVQSVAVRLITEREEERRKFKPEEYYTLDGEINLEGIETAVPVELALINKKTLPKPGIQTKAEAEEAVNNIKGQTGVVEKVAEKETKRNPLPPFITSTLQQEASRRLGYSAKKTMMLAQRLYENGHITYMRTDSVSLSKEAISQAEQVIREKFGDKYTLDKPRHFSQKSKLAQEAHEAIRPTNLEVEAERLSVEKDEAKIYSLIWQRTIAAQMPPAIVKNTTVDFKVENKESYTLRAKGTVLVFDGFLKVWPASVAEKLLPEIKEKTNGEVIKIKAEQHFTEPPARYNEASLIKALEDNGIGRPSTYASIISVIQNRNYVAKDEQKRFLPTEMGETVNKLLTEHFPKIVDIGFTSDIEEELDEVAMGLSNWREVIDNFYKPFKEKLDKKTEEVKKKDVMPVEETNEKCEKCGKPMVIKVGRFGKFMACSGFPECKNTKKIEGGGAIVGKFESQTTGIKCPECKEGELVSRRVSKGRARGKIFWGCNRFPECKYAVWENPTKEKSGD